MGTYRLQTGARAASCHGYYSAEEFEFCPYEALRPQLLELGRACILASHRSFTLLSLLWKGIGAYARERGTRYLIGCSSVPSQDPAAGAAAYQALEPYLVAPAWQTRPIAAFECPLMFPSTSPPQLPRWCPPHLLLLYLHGPNWRNHINDLPAPKGCPRGTFREHTSSQAPFPSTPAAFRVAQD